MPQGRNKEILKDTLMPQGGKRKRIKVFTEYGGVMKRTPYETGGFAFADEKMLEKAVKEEEGIRYIRNSANMKDPQMVFQIYSQMVRQRLFETPVGYIYLKELQDYLKGEPKISNQDIPAIPVAVSKESLIESRETYSGYSNADRPSKSREDGKKSRQRPVKTKTKVIRKTKVQNIDYKPWFRASLSVSVVLLLIVIGMFIVTATSGNINIVNYENALIEKYEDWENQLKEREEKIKEKEKNVSDVQEEVFY